MSIASRFNRIGACFFFFQAEDGIRDYKVTGVQTCALPISSRKSTRSRSSRPSDSAPGRFSASSGTATRSEEHTSELQSPCNLVCRLLLEKKKNTHPTQDRVGQILRQPVGPHRTAARHLKYS